jgi:hypothetical protein
MLLFGEQKRQAKEIAQWRARGFAAPSPAFVKREVLARHNLPDATWVETGTFQGDTTAFLATRAKKVISIEPEPKLYAAAKQRFEGQPKVEIRNGLSEAVLPEVLPTLSGNVCFWLDGHYSAGFTHKGPVDTPIVDELNHIGRALQSWAGVAVLVDDVRCFEPTDPEFRDYPARSHLSRWADQHGLTWTIEHDIFIAKKA